MSLGPMYVLCWSMLLQFQTGDVAYYVHVPEFPRMTTDPRASIIIHDG